MPIEPSAVAMTPALVHASSEVISCLSSEPVYRLLDADGIGQGRQHGPDARIVRRNVVDVAVDDLQPSLEIAAGHARFVSGSVDHEHHLGRRARALEGHEIPQAGYLPAAEAAVEMQAACPQRTIARGFAVRVD